MWSEEINKKILEGEDNNRLTYTDKAWDELETRLDKDLPLKQKRRRIIFLLFPLLLGAGTAWFVIIQKANKDNNSTIGEQKSIPAQSVSSSPDRTEDKNSTIISPSKEGTGDTNPDKAIKQNLAPPVSNNNSIVSTQIENSQTEPPAIKVKKQPKHPYNREVSSFNTTTVKTTSKEKNNLITKKNLTPELTENKDNVVTNNPVKSDPVTADVSNLPSPVVADKKEEDIVQTKTTEANITTKKTRKSFADKFSLSFSVGPDISGVGFDNPGQWQLQYGIGASYALSKNFSLRTGFYAGDKKYTADPKDYHTPYTINNLQKVDADCYIYEIPLSVVYSFDQVKKHNWFIAGGLSSYLMKKETYDYHYKNAWGQPQYHSRTYENESSHLFSAISISGGYQYHFTDRLSFTAEPYVKMPINGIGVGKVKLNNAGVLFTVGYKPFSKK